MESIANTVVNSTGASVVALNNSTNRALSGNNGLSSTIFSVSGQNGSIISNRMDSTGVIQASRSLNRTGANTGQNGNIGQSQSLQTHSGRTASNLISDGSFATPVGDTGVRENAALTQRNEDGIEGIDGGELGTGLDGTTGDNITEVTAPVAQELTEQELIEIGEFFGFYMFAFNTILFAKVTQQANENKRKQGG